MTKTRSLLSVPLLCLFTVAPVAAQDPDVDEVVAYQAWYAASTGGDLAKATEAARAYLEKFPGGQNAEYLGKWLAGAQWNAFADALKKKDMDQMVRLGQERLKQDPKDLTYLYWMALNLRQNELLGPADSTHAEQAADFSKRAIELISADGKPAGVDAAKWEKNAQLAWLQQNLALIAAKKGDSKEALRRYEASSALAPNDKAIQARNALGCGSLEKDLYDQAVGAYQALPESERSAEGPSPAATTAIDEANKHADAAIGCWARFLGVTSGGGAEEVRERIESALSALYQYRHPDTPDGYKALVEKNRSGN